MQGMMNDWQCDVIGGHLPVIQRKLGINMNER
jgi:hypothetical protein